MEVTEVTQAATLTPWLHTLISGAMLLFGAMLGSFALTAGMRYAKGEGFVLGRSHCDACKKTLRLRDLVPVLGFISLRGRCHFCKAPISLLYPIFEFCSGLFFLFAYLSLGLSPTLLGIALVFVPLVLLAVHDLEREIIPDVILLPLMAAVFCYKWLILGTNPLFMALAGLGAALFFYGLRWYGKRVKSRIVLGLGDVKLGILLGFFTLDNVFLVSALGSFIAGIYAIGLVRYRERKGEGLTEKDKEEASVEEATADPCNTSPLQQLRKEQEEQEKALARGRREALWENLEIPLAPWLILALIPFVFY